MASFLADSLQHMLASAPTPVAPKPVPSMHNHCQTGSHNTSFMFQAAGMGGAGGPSFTPPGGGAEIMQQISVAAEAARAAQQAASAAANAAAAAATAGQMAIQVAAGAATNGLMTEKSNVMDSQNMDAFTVGGPTATF